MVDWWSETENAMLESLGSAGAMSPQDLARRVGISEGETMAFPRMLARENKILIHLVGVRDVRASRSPRGAARVRDKAPAHAAAR